MCVQRNVTGSDTPGPSPWRPRGNRFRLRRANAHRVGEERAGIEHVRSVAGMDHVGIATDLNGPGANTVVPTHREFGLIAAGLLGRGHSGADVEKIVGGNFMRVFREVTETRG